MLDYAEFILIPKQYQVQLASILKHYNETGEEGSSRLIGDVIGMIQHAARIVLPRVFEFRAAGDGGIIHLCAWTEKHARQEIENTPWLKGQGPFTLESSWVEWPGMGIMTPEYSDCYDYGSESLSEE